MTPRLDHEIDRLYQLPLEEFTAARNGLAKTAGKDAAEVKALSKPPVAAWAVNQLYWHRGPVWNELIAAADQARRANHAALAGRASDIRAAGKVHDEAVEKALKATLELLKAAGHPATDATRQAVLTTLRALPGGERPGRLTHTLQPGGFELLAGLPVASAPRAQTSPAHTTPEAKAAVKARKEAAAAAREKEAAEQAKRRHQFELARAEREEQRANDAVSKARQVLDRAQAALEEAEAAAGRAAETVAGLKRTKL